MVISRTGGGLAILRHRPRIGELLLERHQGIFRASNFDLHGASDFTMRVSFVGFLGFGGCDPTNWCLSLGSRHWIPPCIPMNLMTRGDRHRR